MQVQVKVTKILAAKSGVSSSGKEWSLQEFIGETLEQFPKQICFSIFNPDNAYKQVPSAGMNYNVSISIESRSFAGRDGVERWSTNVNVSSIEPFGTQEPQSPAAPPSCPSPTAGAPAPSAAEPMHDDSAPF